MDLKNLVKLFTPPIMLGVARRLRHGLSSRAIPIVYTDYAYVPEGWHADVEATRIKGWNVQDILEVQKGKWERFKLLTSDTGPLGFSHEGELLERDDVWQHNRIMIFAYSIALASRRRDHLSFLDWGGGIGHYYLLARSLLPDVTLEYHCKDVPYLADYGAKMLLDQHFYSDDSCLKRTYDFVAASSSLHYSQNWQEVFCGLVSASLGYLLVTRLPTVEKVPSYVFVQRPYAFGYNTEYLAWCLNREDFLMTADKLGLQLVREFIIGPRPRIAHAPEQAISRGFLFRRQGDSCTDVSD